ncbi:MAG: amidohydrolase family protein [Acidimicrobiales bacterium]
MAQNEAVDMVARWAASGAMALTGRADAAALGPPDGLVPGLDRLARLFPDLDPLSLLAERAALAGLVRQGRTSCGGRGRLLRTGDGWLALSLPRRDDLDLLPAWLEPTTLGGCVGSEADPPWGAVATAVRGKATADLEQRGAQLGLALAGLGSATPRPPVVATALGVAPARSPRGTVVVDLSALWAGPLCGALLAGAGASVVKVESTTRPDGTRSGPAAFFDRLNAGKRSVVLDLTRRDGVATLPRLVEQADVVIEASRPRPSANWGSTPPPAWRRADLRCGCRSPATAATTVPAAPGSGMTPQWRADWPSPTGPVLFCADAIADPCAGLAAASACLASLAAGGAVVAGRGDVGGGCVPGRTDPPGVDLAGRVTADGTRALGPVTALRGRHGGGAQRARRRAMTSLLLRDVELDGRRADVRCVDGVVASVGSAGAGAGADEVVVGGGGALLPGLHDHHVHLMAMAADARSVDVGPGAVAGPSALGRALRATADRTPSGQWVRATKYHDSVAGPLDRSVLDGLVGDRPVRVQHRSGAMWILSSAACRAIGLDDAPPVGAERDSDGRPTGRLVRLDRWLRTRLPPGPEPDLQRVAHRLNRLGVTGVTDTTPVESPADLDALAGAGPTLRVQATGAIALAGADFPPGVGRGPVKVVLSDHDLPSLDELTGWFHEAHGQGRPVAVHCVTRASLVLALAAWDLTGVGRSDRIEHGSVIPAELIATLARLGLTVVTQPGFVAERGDHYLAEVDPADLGDLYRCATLLDGGVRMAASTDAPYTDPDPWSAIAAAVTRRTRTGRRLGPGERIVAERALALFLGPLCDPGAGPRRVRVGAPADLVLLDVPRTRALGAPRADDVVITVVGGQIAWRGA